MIEEYAGNAAALVGEAITLVVAELPFAGEGRNALNNIVLSLVP